MLSDAGRTAVVTGSSGFVGSVLARTLAEQGWSVVGVDRDPPPWWRDLGGAKTTLMDLVTLEPIADLVADLRPDVVFHLAAQPFVPDSVNRPYPTIADNVMATASVLEASRLAGVRRVVHASSGAVYGGAPGDTTYTEQHPSLVGPNLYGPTKIAAENIAVAYAQTFGLDVRIGRFMNTYGPGDTSPTRIVPTALRQALSTDTYAFGDRDDGSTALDFVYVDDVVDGYIAAAHAPYTGPIDCCGIYNFGSGSTISMRDLATRIAAIAGVERDPVFGGPPARVPRRKCLDPAYALEALGWSSVTTLDDGLRATVDWYRKYLAEDR